MIRRTRQTLDAVTVAAHEFTRTASGVGDTFHAAASHYGPDLLDTNRAVRHAADAHAQVMDDVHKLIQVVKPLVVLATFAFTAALVAGVLIELAGKGDGQD